uniref:Choline transporter-like protein n=1 Tax=Oncorhynchus tshawytscha TaxID=74940 RepID=A0A8C8HVX8_ONCTS
MCINSLTFILKNRPSENSSILLLNHYLSVFFSGEPAQYDPTFNGPIRKRGCTDIICCVLFMVVILGYMAVGILAWLYGDPRHVLYPRNSTGMFCGIGLNVAQPSVFYFDILKCATSINVMAAVLNGLQCPTTQYSASCCFVSETLSVITSVNRSFPGLCCSDIVNSFNAKEIGVRIFEDFASSWQWIIAAVSHMMSTLFYPLVTFVLLVVCVAYWGITALYLATSGNPVYKVVTLNSTQGNCGQIGGNVTCDPQVNYSWCPSARCIFIKYNNEGLLQRNLFNLQIYNVVAFLWCINFVIALGQCTLAGAFASYYWAFSKPSDIPTFPLSQAFIRTLRYHVGSLAFGALILTLIQVVRIILEYLDHKTRAAQNPCARFLMCCLKCCFWCLEKFIKFLNRNAYIMIAVYGKNFCVSAKNAFMLLMRNIVRVVVLDKVTDLLLFFGKLLVVGGVGVLAFFFFSGRIRLPGSNFRTEMLNYYWMPIIVVVVGAYLIAHGFFSVYNMCVDTLFLCFLEDLERHDGTIQKPYYMSKNLMKILNKKNKGPKKGKGKD